MAFLKMLIFPKISYPILNLPLLLKHEDVKKIDKVLNNFMWQKKKPKISFEKLQKVQKQ